MKEISTGKLIKIFIQGDDKYKGEPLYTAIIDKLKESGVSGATIIRGIEGFGEDKKIHSDFLEVLSRKLPIVIEIVAREDKVEKILEIASSMIKTGKIAIIDNVEVINFKK
ncbi:DUF190 domain-containing protein [Clostridium sp.]|uniref:DUF190 domain-containing protein n=1 Tax=Clostridium sp. TaxID=1506 RepID=UPI0026DD0B70|nr:DUF190 domain-containing protein [Clostridium sp.]MDO5039807.1 DUF190 domain-containing protein [Clostridium sp.]